VTRSV